MRKFVTTHLGPVDRLGEILFGLVMALGFTAAVRMGHAEADRRELFVQILGCNVAWGIVDGVMYALSALAHRGLEARVVRGVAEAGDDTRACAAAAAAARLDVPLVEHATDEERRRLEEWIVGVARRAGSPQVALRREDVLGAVAVATVIVMATAPMLVPYLVVPDTESAVHVSHAIGLAMLFLLGARWGRLTGVRPWAVGAGLLGIGLVLVGVTVALGG